MLRGAIVVRIETLSFSRRISASASILDEIISEIANEVLLLKKKFEQNGFDYFVNDYNKLNFLNLQ